MFRFPIIIILVALWPTIGQAKEVKMTVAGSPPYVFAESNTGIVMDILREALAFKGHEFVPVIVPVKRVVYEFKLGNVDAAAISQGLDEGGKAHYKSETSVTYYDFFFTLAERNLKIQAPEDLNDLKIVSFPIASKVYPNWLVKVEEESRYTELPDQLAQLKMLYRGRADAVLADENIIKYLANRLASDSGQPKKELTVSTSPGNLSSIPVFWDQEVRDDFNAGIRHLRETDRYQAIIDKYTK